MPDQQPPAPIHPRTEPLLARLEELVELGMDMARILELPEDDRPSQKTNALLQLNAISPVTRFNVLATAIRRTIRLHTHLLRDQPASPARTARTDTALARLEFLVERGMECARSTHNRGLTQHGDRVWGDTRLLNTMDLSDPAAEFARIATTIRKTVRLADHLLRPTPQDPRQGAERGTTPTPTPQVDRLDRQDLTEAELANPQSLALALAHALGEPPPDLALEIADPLLPARAPAPEASTDHGHSPRLPSPEDTRNHPH